MIFPFRIMPFVWTVLISGGLIGVLWGIDEIGDRREAKVRQELAKQREAEKEAERQAAARAGEEAEAARRTALQPGSLARLRAGWCRDCVEAR